MDFVEQLKSSIDIVAVVGEYVRLRKAGARYVGLCPFHSEKSPSFSVHATHQFYKCFGCGAGGDVLNFVMAIEGLTFFEALKHLAERHGIPMPKRTRLDDEESRLREAVYEMHELAGKAFRAALESAAGSGAREYIKKRGLSSEVAAEFGLGFAERSGQMLVRLFQREGFAADQMAASKLVMKRQDGSGWYDLFRGRLMFPIQNESGKIIAFAGRTLATDEEPKYMNSPETPIYRKSHVLYNLHKAKQPIRENGRSILVEGYMDVIGLRAAGVREAVASCGTALTSQQVRSLHRHADKVVVNFDPDAAGAGASERSIQMLLEEGMHIRILELGGGLDPDEYVRAHGEGAYRERLTQAAGYFHWLADRVRGRFDMTTAEGRVAGLRSVLMPAIQRIPDKLERAAVAEEVANYLRVDPALVRDEFRARGSERRPARQSPADEVHPKEKLLISLLLSNQSARSEIAARLRELKTIEQFRTWPLLRIMLQLEESGEPWSYASVGARLEESAKALFDSIALSDPMLEQERSPEEAVAFVQQLERKEREARMNELRARATEAEKAGNLHEALRLTEELNRFRAS